MRFNPGGIPVSSSQVVSASVCLSVEPSNIPPTASYAEWADFPSGSDGSPVVNIVVGNVVLIGPPPPGPTPTITPTPSCPEYGQYISGPVCLGVDYVIYVTNGECGETPLVTCANTTACGGAFRGCEEPE
jgi:hypothetical protein